MPPKRDKTEEAAKVKQAPDTKKSPVVKDPLVAKCREYYCNLLGADTFDEEIEEVRGRVVEMLQAGELIKTHVCFVTFKQNEVEHIKTILFDYHTLKDEKLARKLPVIEVVTPEADGEKHILCYYEAKDAQKNAEAALKAGIPKQK